MAIVPLSTGVAGAAGLPPRIDPIPNQCWTLNQPIPPLPITAHPGVGSQSTITNFSFPAGLPQGSFTLSGLSFANNFMDVTAVLTGTPTAIGFGTASETVTQADGQQATVFFNYNVPSMPCGTNVVTVQPIPDQIFTAGVPICPINVEANNNNHRSLGYHIAGQPGGVSIPNGSTGSHLITGTATAAPGGGTATVTVNDPDDITGTASFNYQVNNPSSDTLQPNSIMQQGGAIFSPDGKYELTLQTDGNLVVYGTAPGASAPAVPVWSLGTTTGAVLSNQCQGNLVLYDANGKALWATPTDTQGPSRLVMQNGGNLVLYRDTGSGNVATWGTGSQCEPLTTTDRLQSGECMARGGIKLHSPDGRFTLWLQNAGNLVLYQGTTVLWAVQTQQTATDVTSGGGWLINQSDGNLVLFPNIVNNTALFQTSTGGNGPSTLILQNDGNLVLYRNSDNKPIWSSGTCCH